MVGNDVGQERPTRDTVVIAELMIPADDLFGKTSHKVKLFGSKALH